MDKSDIRKLRSGSKWTAIGALTGVVSQLLIMISLAWFLQPSDVGLFSIFLFIVGLGVTVLPLGNDFSFVQAEKLVSGDIVRMLLISGSLGLISIGFVYSSFSLFTYESSLVPTTIIFGILVGLAESIFLLLSAALQRDLDYRSIERANIVRQLLTLGLSILLLALLRSVEGAFYGRLIANTVAVTIVATSVYRSIGRGKAVSKIMSNVARDMLAKNMLGHISRNAEIVAGAPQLGVQGLGIYDLGRRIVAQPRDLIGSILFKYTYPMFAKIVKIESEGLRVRFLRRSYGEVVRIASLVGFPVFAIALLLADPLIPSVLGSEWSPATSVVQIFAVTAFVQVLGNNIITSALTAVGGSGVVLRAEYMILIPRLVAVFAASFFGPIAVALTMSAFIIFKLMWMQHELNKLSTLTFALVIRVSAQSCFAAIVGLMIGAVVKLYIGGTVGAIGSSVAFLVLYGSVISLMNPNAIPTKFLSASIFDRGMRH